MPVYTIQLRDKKEIAAGTMAFYFDKPDGFTYKAGQFGDFTLINPTDTDDEGNVRGFSLSSAPFETGLMLATRMRDTAYKRYLKTMPVGTAITMDAPYGSFTLQNNTKIPAVFLSGGIGITPVRSIVLQATHNKTAHKIFLFYANKTPQDAAFLDELTEAGNNNPNFTFVASMTATEQSEEWQGERGVFTREMLQKYIGDLTLPIYYVSGPAAMVTAIRKTLNEAGVDDDNIRTEEFPGY
ncbi:FAD-dependent oxidoreductase [Ilyomonas limi]|uniref:FAD-dependent oxidoreductase n=1 Tax=Ilyomonas limi TaxID=2575867 RepID=A0A4U3L6X3_9BACT|nr:FAD-dependent oxidoreductase [Ilyomonas limi]TKK71001.1 FAD-dependent oxidoreductase [Ilyomonas limi]